MVLKKGRKSVRNREVWERSLEGSFCFITQKPPNLVELKIVLEGGFGGFSRFLRNFNIKSFFNSLSALGPSSTK
jgi:hypothetical protein